MPENQKQSSLLDWLQAHAVHVSRIHFYLAAIYTLYIVLSDAWNLITSDVVLRRFSVAAALLIFTSIFWFAAHNKVLNTLYYKVIIYGFIVADILFATFTIYSQRGMSSRGIVLYALPLAVSAVLLSRRALLATASLCTAAYSLAAISYFVKHPSEGYYAELYIEVGFYCTIFFVLVALLWTVIHPKP